jgi:hypothetical protein
LLLSYQIPFTYSFDSQRESSDLFGPDLLSTYTATGKGASSSTEHATIVFPAVVQNTDYRLTLRISSGSRPKAGPALRALVAVNGVPVREVQLASIFQEYEFPLEQAVVSRANNLLVDIQVLHSEPSQPISGKTDNSSSAPLVQSAELVPVGLPLGLIGLPPWTQSLGWTLCGVLLAGLVLQLGLKARLQERAVVIVGALLLFLGFLFLRPLVASYSLFIWAALVLGVVLIRPVVVWLAELRATRRIPLGFLHTLGIPQPRVRAAVELAIIAVIASYFFLNTIWPLRKADLSDFGVYYVASGVWLQGGDFYDDAQFQQFNLTHRPLYTLPPAQCFSPRSHCGLTPRPR